MADPKLINYYPKSPSLLETRAWTKPDGTPSDNTFFLPMGRVKFVAAANPSLSREAEQKNIAAGRDPKDGATYSISLVISDKANLSPLMDAAKAMAKAAFGKSTVKMPWVRAEDKLETADWGVLSLDGFWLVNANSYMGPIPVVDSTGAKLQDPNSYDHMANADSCLYPGCFAVAEVRLKTFDVKDEETGTRAQGVKLYLRSIQVVRKAPRIGEGLSEADQYAATSEEDDDAMNAAFAGENAAFA